MFVYNDGQQTSRKIGDKKLAVQVAAKLEKQLAENKVGLMPGKTDCPTFKEYALSWLETQAKLSFKGSTYNSYGLILKRYLIPEFVGPCV